MKSYLFVFLLSLFSYSTLFAFEDDKTIYSTFEVSTIYNKLEGANIPSFDVFEKGLNGFQLLKAEGKISSEKNIVTIIDFRLESSKKRMWIIDIKSFKVLYHTYVSHGRNTGNKKALRFSNTIQSLQSSLGFYVTGETYHGKHGLSLRLDGMESGFNNNARRRAIVLHSADYATEDFVKKHGRLGRSYGCPAIPPHNYNQIVDVIKNGTAIFIYYPEKKYLAQSKYLRGIG